MSNSVWTAPPEPPTAEGARRGILAQHVRLRELLAKAQVTAEDALDGKAAAPDTVASAIGDIRAVFEVHLTFEERVLQALLEADPARAAARAEHVRIDHERQRAMLSGLHREARAVPELPTLAAKLAFLVMWLLRDMEEEERDLLA
jgi:hypothetical protein